jgi:hypothetical protein
MTLEHSRKSNPVLSRCLSTNFLELTSEHESKWVNEKIDIVIKEYLDSLHETEKNLNNRNMHFLHKEYDVLEYIKHIKKHLFNKLYSQKAMLYSNFDKVNHKIYEKNDKHIQNKLKTKNTQLFGTVEADKILFAKSKDARFMREFKDTNTDDRLIIYQKFRDDIKRSFVDKSIDKFNSNMNVHERVIEEYLKNHDSRAGMSRFMDLKPSSEELDLLYSKKSKVEKEGKY